MTGEGHDYDTCIAVIGMAGRFPQAPDIDAFWAACRDGTECISRWHGPTEAPGRVFAGGLLAGQELFDAGAFGVPPAEAEILDPQHRVFLEVCWEGLEHASVVPGREASVSVYAAAAPSRYRPDVDGDGDGDEDENARYHRLIANGPDYLATRVSYLLDLRGEAVNVQTACSSSLVAVHLACQSLLACRSDVALAGGVSIDPEQDRGYAYQEGMIASPDGKCRPFDAAAQGAVPGNSAAVVVMQRLSDALEQGRRVHAVIRATAVNNDGRAKSGFMAPNVQGQSEVIATALAVAGVPAESIGYLEAHGTGTRLGDPIEVEAARTAFRMFTDRRAFCALGSLKGNFGHLDRAAGVTGLIKAVHAVRDGEIPPLAGFTTPNPDLDLASSPFRCPVTAEAWRAPWPRRAGVSSFGVGGTNAHAIVEEFRVPSPRDEGGAGPDGPVALALSAHSQAALGQLGRDLAAAFEGTRDHLDLAHTLAAGRLPRAVRAVVVAGGEALAGLLRDLPPAVTAPAETGRLALLFPGQGAEVSYDARLLAARYPVFRDEIRRFADAAGMPVELLLDGVGGRNPAYRSLAYQPALAAVQVALARLAEHAGVISEALCGSSVGEYAAAHLAGVFDHAGLMTVLACRDDAMRASPEGRMMAVSCSWEDAGRFLLPEVELAGDNCADRVLLSGPPGPIERQQRLFAERGVPAYILPGLIAPHGRLMMEAASRFRKAFDGVRLGRASRPVVSTLTGTWAAPDELANPEHWIRHLCEPLRFRQALQTLAAAGYDRFAESSPGNALTKLVRASRGATAQATTLGGEPGTDPVTSFLVGLGELWCSGSPVNWDAANRCADAKFAVLPPYPFQRTRFWRHRPAQSARRAGWPAGESGGWSRPMEAPVWRPQLLADRRERRVLPRLVIVHGEGPLALALGAKLREQGVRTAACADVGPDDCGPGSVLVDLTLAGPCGGGIPAPADRAALTAWLDRGLFGPLVPLRRLRPSRHLTVVRGLSPVAPGESSDPASAAVIGMVRCAPHDWPGLQTAIVDLDPAGEHISRDVAALVAELAVAAGCDVAYRGAVRYRRGYEPVAVTGPGLLREGGTYLVIGGTGQLGAVVAEAISREVTATIVLTGRDPRRAPAPEAEALVAAARRRGCGVVRHELRGGDPAALRACLDELTAEHGRVDGIFHLAANTVKAEFGLLPEITMASACAVAEAKVCTAALLAGELAGKDYDFVVLFSSLSTVIGALRFGAYVSANAYLDALAVRMRASTGRPWFSLVWDGWTADGAPADNGLGSADGADLLRRALRSDRPVLAPVAQPVERRVAAVRADLATVARAEKDAAHGTAGTSVADQVLELVARVTGHTGIDPRQSFAGLGIDSLQMMQIAVRLRPLLGQALPIGTLLAARSAAEISALATAADDARPPGIPASRGAGDAKAGKQELSTPQKRLWYLSQLDPGSSGYNVPFGWLLPEAASADTARAAVLATLERHEMLCSAYRLDEQGEPVRKTLRPQDVPVTEADLDPDDPEGSFGRVARDFVERPIDLGHCCTQVLIATGAERIRLVFVCHHISVDAWSVRIIHDELLRHLSGMPEPGETPRASYRDFVQLERDAREGPDYERLAEYWRGVLRNAQPTVPPADAGMVPSSARPAGIATGLLPARRLEGLRAAVRAQGATFYTACLTGLSVALSQWCSTPEIVIGTNLANRARPELETVVGMFVDPVVLRLAPGAGQPVATNGTALAAVRDQFTSSIAHSDIPYLDVVRLSGRSGTAADNPLFSIIATMFDTEGSGPRLASLELPLPATSKFALAVEFLPREDGLLVHAIYAADRYLPTTIGRLLDRTIGFLTSLACDGPDAPLPGAPPHQAATPARERFARRFRQFHDAAAPVDSPVTPAG